MSNGGRAPAAWWQDIDDDADGSAAQSCSVVVKLSNREWFYACQIGLWRQIDNLLKGRVDRYGAGSPGSDGWKLHREGACGEMVVAKHFGLFWSGSLNDLQAADVGPLQVRATAWPSGKLLVHEYEKDDEAFVLVTGTGPEFVIHGWLLGREAKQERFWSDPQRTERPAFFVPQSELHPITSLKVVSS